MKTLADSGYRRQTLRRDGEPALSAVCNAAAQLAMLDHPAMDVIPETTQKGDSAANGLAEGAVRDDKAKV